MLQSITAKSLYTDSHVLENNLISQYNKATNNNTEIPDNWYVIQKSIIKNKFKEHDFITTCGVISALSPRMNWDYNLISAKYLIDNHDKVTMRELINNTHQTTANINKAIHILHSASAYEIFDRLNSDKTQNFYMNLVDPSCSDYVTLDYHMIKSIQLVGKQALTKKQYGHIKSIIIDVAKGYGIVPCHFQAILWEHQR